MTVEQKRHFIVEHVWRFIRASLILTAMVIWLVSDGMQSSDWWVLGFGAAAHLVEQFHGKICNAIERVLNWQEDFNEWD